MSLDAKRGAKEIHFTLPESLWLTKRGFFQSFGFRNAEKASRQYRSSEAELWSSASFNIMWASVLEKLPKIITSLTKTHDNIFNGILMSIEPKYVEKIKSGEKIVEVRKRFNTKWRNCRVTIYSSNPDKAILGYATIANIMKGSPERIWSRYGGDIGCTKREFEAYTASSEEVYALFLEDYKPYTNQVYLSQISYLLDNKAPKPPQSYISLEKNMDWARAVSVAELLHNRFWLYTPVI
jgi:predicted transcriptional regulator